MAKLMCGILPLETETGRYQGVPLEGRTCRMCGLDIMSTEYHFIFYRDRSKFDVEYIENLEQFMLLSNCKKVKVSM